MDIALMSMVFSQGQIQQQASMSVMKQVMGNAKQQGEALQKLMGTSDATSDPTHSSTTFGWHH